MIDRQVRVPCCIVTLLRVVVVLVVEEGVDNMSPFMRQEIKRRVDTLR